MGILCQINIFKPPNAVFHPGDAVSGVIKYTLDDPMEFDQVIASLKGCGILKIRVTSHTSRRVNDIYSTNETYVDIDSIVSGKTKVLQGSYEVQFNFQIPKSVPSSFNYKNTFRQYKISCQVRYYVRIKFERPGWFALSKHYKKEILVVSEITPSLLMEPVIYGQSKKLMRLFSRRNAQIMIKATIHNSVIPIGGKILIDYEINNDSKVAISKIETRLLEIYIFKIRYSKLKICEEVPKVQSDIGRIECRLLKPLTLQINVPDDKVTLQNSEIAQRDYVVRIKASLPIPHRSIVIEIPVEIGTANEVISKCVTNVYDLASEPPSYWENMDKAFICEDWFK